MSKKQLIALANIIRYNPAAFSPEAVNALANFCQQQNPQLQTRPLD